MSKIQRALVTLVLLVPYSVLVAYILTAMWGWFVVPLGAPGLGMAHAYGLALLATVVKGLSADKGGKLVGKLQYPRTSAAIVAGSSGVITADIEPVDQDHLLGLAKSTAFVLLAWGFGAIAHALM